MPIFQLVAMHEQLLRFHPRNRQQVHVLLEYKLILECIHDCYIRVNA